MKRTIVWLSNSLYRVAGLYIGSVIVCACLFSWIEGRTLVDSLYWATVTSLTIGYGDISPQTAAGKLVTMFFAHVWVFGVAPLIITNILTVTLEDRNAFTHEEQEEMKAMLKEIRQDVHQVI